MDNSDLICTMSLDLAMALGQLERAMTGLGNNCILNVRQESWVDVLLKNSSPGSDLQNLKLPQGRLQPVNKLLSSVQPVHSLLRRINNFI